MAKIKITSEQYNTILLREQKSRLGTSDTEILEEGWKEVVLGVAMLLGVGLTGVNKVVAQNALKNDSTMAEIKATLEDETRTQDLSKAFTEKGLKNPDLLLAKNAKKVMDEFNKVATDNHIKYKVTNKVVDNLISLDAELAKGYALKKAETSTDVKSSGAMTIVTVKDTIDIELGSDKLFVTAGFTLNQSGVGMITSTVDSIKNLGGKIVSITIESSTDAESIPKFRDENDVTGNIKLALLRTKSVSDLLKDLDGDVSISHREIPNNGSDIISTKQFSKASTNPKELELLRAKTSEYRYVKIKIVGEFTKEEPSENPMPDEIIKKYRFELVKAFDVNNSNGGGKLHFKHKKVKCKKMGKTASCFSF